MTSRASGRGPVHQVQESVIALRYVTWGMGFDCWRVNMDASDLRKQAINNTDEIRHHGSYAYEASFFASLMCGFPKEVAPYLLELPLHI